MWEANKLLFYCAIIASSVSIGAFSTQIPSRSAVFSVDKQLKSLLQKSEHNVNRLVRDPARGVQRISLAPLRGGDSQTAGGSPHNPAFTPHNGKALERSPSAGTTTHANVKRTPPAPSKPAPKAVSSGSSPSAALHSHAAPSKSKSPPSSSHDAKEGEKEKEPRSSPSKSVSPGATSKSVSPGATSKSVSPGANGSPRPAGFGE
eukprot:2489926-Rhodomonas_salina.5